VPMLERRVNRLLMPGIEQDLIHAVRRVTIMIGLSSMEEMAFFLQYNSYLRWSKILILQARKNARV